MDFFEIIDSNELTEQERLNEKEVITYNGHEIEVRTYIPFDEKLMLADAIALVLTNPINGFVSTRTLIPYFNSVVIRHYTNIEFDGLTNHQIIDYLFTNYEDLVDKILVTIPEEEYNTLLEIVGETITEHNEYLKTMTGAMDVLTKRMGDNLNILQTSLEALEGTDYNYVKELAEATGMNNGQK